MLEKFIQLNNSQFGIGKRLTNERIKNLLLILTVKNLRRLALVGGVAALSAVAFSPKAQAQTAEVDFNGTIPTTCTFTGTTSGSLASSPSKDWVEASNGSVSGFNLGTAGATSLTCNASASVSISAPVKVSAPDNFSDADRQALLYDPAGNSVITSNFIGDSNLWPSYPTTPGTINSSTTYNFKIAMNAGDIGADGNVVPGTYSYKVTVTATPN